jgi:PIN domain nuclease of toxin-antitoxin system
MAKVLNLYEAKSQLSALVEEAADGAETGLHRQEAVRLLPESFASMVTASDFQELALTLRHTEQLGSVALHHSDPFDRMLIAQAQIEKITIVTHDRQFEPYDVPIIWV